MNKTMTNLRNLKSYLRRFALAGAFGVGMSGVAACDGLLEVELPGDMTEADLFQPVSASMLVNSVITDFECAYSMFTAVMSGYEDTTWRTSGYWPAQATYGGQRPGSGSCPQQSDTATNYHMSFQKSRYLAEEAHSLLGSWTDAEVANRGRLLATAATYAGLFYQIHGETFCEFAPDNGPLLTPRQMMQRAEEWYTAALSQIGSGDYEIVSTSSLRQLALLGRARARLSLGDHAGAAADAAQIQPDFVAYVTRDASVRGRWNGVYQAFNVFQWRTVAGPVWWWRHDPDRLVSAGYYDLTIAPDGSQTVDDGVPDPRVPVQRMGAFSQDGITEQYNQTKYGSIADDIPMARWAEAQLILAEIEGGQSAVNRINAVRDIHGLPHFSSNDEDEIYSAIIEEMRREFFFEGRFYANKLRLGLWFPRGQGRQHRDFAYGTGYCQLMPTNDYQLNPHITESFGAGYEGPDTGDLTYKYQLRVDRVANWPVPSELPLNLAP